MLSHAFYEYHQVKLLFLLLIWLNNCVHLSLKTGGISFFKYCRFDCCNIQNTFSFCFQVCGVFSTRHLNSAGCKYSGYSRQQIIGFSKPSSFYVYFLSLFHCLFIIHFITLTFFLPFTDYCFAHLPRSIASLTSSLAIRPHRFIYRYYLSQGVFIYSVCMAFPPTLGLLCISEIK